MPKKQRFVNWETSQQEEMADSMASCGSLWMELFSPGGLSRFVCRHLVLVNHDNWTQKAHLGFARAPHLGKSNDQDSL